MATVKGRRARHRQEHRRRGAGCNNFEVVDPGDGAGAEDPRHARDVENADIIGLSGLITPSLEEMSHVAREMRARVSPMPR